MKKLLPLIASLILLIVSSCKKDNTLPPIEPMDIAMPAIVFPLVNTPVDWSGEMQFKGISFNIDSVIRAESNNRFTQQHVRSITVKSINLQLLNADSENNLGNYERLDVYLVIRNADNLRLQGSRVFDTAFAAAASLETDGHNLKSAIDSIPYKGFMYTIYGDVRKNMKAMDAKVDIVYHLE